MSDLAGAAICVVVDAPIWAGVIADTIEVMKHSLFV